MSRPTKQGIAYFPLDVQFDDKVELLIADKGSNALSVLITAWQLIYQNEGYYVDGGDDLYLLIRRRIMIEKDNIQEIVMAAIDRDIFDKPMHKKYKILTSRAIQKRYFIAASRKKIVNVYKNYLLVCVNEYKNIHFLGVNVVHQSPKEKEDVKEEEDVKVKVVLSVLQILWNENCTNLSKVLGNSEQRKVKERARLSERSPKEWGTIFRIINNSRFCCGHSDQKWKATFDWIMKNENNAVKVLEGQYDNKDSVDQEEDVVEAANRVVEESK